MRSEYYPISYNINNKYIKNNVNIHKNSKTQYNIIPKREK